MKDFLLDSNGDHPLEVGVPGREYHLSFAEDESGDFAGATVTVGWVQGASIAEFEDGEFTAPGGAVFFLPTKKFNVNIAGLGAGARINVVLGTAATRTRPDAT